MRCNIKKINKYTPSLKSRHIADFLQLLATSRTAVAWELRAFASSFGSRKPPRKDFLLKM